MPAHDFLNFFSHNILNRNPRIIHNTGKLWSDSNSVYKLAKFVKINGIDFFQPNDTTSSYNFFRGTSVEHYLGSYLHGCLGIASMRYGLAKFMHENKLPTTYELTEEMKKKFISEHVSGIKDKANSFSGCPFVALGFGLTASEETVYKDKTITASVPGFHVGDRWSVDYNETDRANAALADELDCGTSLFSYQDEIIVPNICLPIQQVFLLQRQRKGMLHAEDFDEAKFFDAANYGEGIAEVKVQSTEFHSLTCKYQGLEIKKVIAFQEYVNCATDSNNQDTYKTYYLYQKYKSFRFEQLGLLHKVAKIDEKNRWIDIANHIAPRTYLVMHADDDGFYIELPGHDENIIKRISNDEIRITLAPLFETDSRLEIDDIKNGKIPSATNFLIETEIRKNKRHINMAALKDRVVADWSLPKKSFRMTE